MVTPRPVYGIADRAAAVDVAAHAVNDGAPDPPPFGGGGEDVAPAGDALFAPRDDKNPIVRRNRLDDRGNQMRCGCRVGLSTHLDGAGATNNLRTVPEWSDSKGGALELQEVQGIGHGIGV